MTNFDALDEQMRGYEQSLDRTIPDNLYLVARLDGHGFTRLTKEEMNLEKPFDIRFHEAMIQTLRHMMSCGFRFIYGYTQSDEISLLFHAGDQTFGRRERKLLSILAAEASVAFSKAASHSAVFDCRLSPLPDRDAVVNYFHWRQEDSHRNSLNSHCYWLLRKLGHSAPDAHDRMAGESNAHKLQLLSSNGIHYDKLPLWQIRGVGIYRINEQKEGYNPITKQNTSYSRRTLFLEKELPTGEPYAELIRALIEDNQEELK